MKVQIKGTPKELAEFIHKVQLVQISSDISEIQDDKKADYR